MVIRLLIYLLGNEHLQVISKADMNKKEHFVSEHIRKNPFSFAAILLAGFVNSCVSFLLPVSIGEFFTLYFHTGSSKGKLLSFLGLHLDTVQELPVVYFTPDPEDYSKFSRKFWQLLAG